MNWKSAQWLCQWPLSNSLRICTRWETHPYIRLFHTNNTAKQINTIFCHSQFAHPWWPNNIKSNNSQVRLFLMLWSGLPRCIEIIQEFGTYPVATSHILIVLSLLAETMKSPLGKKVTLDTLWSWPAKHRKKHLGHWLSWHIQYIFAFRLHFQCSKNVYFITM